MLVPLKKANQQMVINRRIISFLKKTLTCFFIQFSQGIFGWCQERVSWEMGKASAGNFSISILVFVLEHCLSRWLRQNQNSWNGFIWSCYACTAQSQKDLLCHEDSRQAKGGETQTGWTYPKWKANPTSHQLSLPC